MLYLHFIARRVRIFQQVVIIEIILVVVRLVVAVAALIPLSERRVACVSTQITKAPIPSLPQQPLIKRDTWHTDVRSRAFFTVFATPYTKTHLSSRVCTTKMIEIDRLDDEIRRL
jgi:hypothetical protein